MIDRKDFKKKQARKIMRLVEEHARATVMARVGPIGFPGCADYFNLAIEKQEELWKYMFGTDNMVKLAEEWGMLKKRKKKKRKRK